MMNSVIDADSLYTDDDQHPNTDGSEPGVIELGSGAWLDIMQPDPSQINMFDIAHGLGNLCRFGGHTSRFYSVAEHSVLCVALMRSIDNSPEMLKAALLHDAHETFVGDIPTPIKRTLRGWVKVSDRLDEAVTKRFGLEPGIFDSDQVKIVDRQALSLEARQFMSLNTPGFKEGLIPVDQITSDVTIPGIGFAWPDDHGRYEGRTMFLRCAEMIGLPAE